MNATLASRAATAIVLLASVGLPVTATAQYHLPTIVSSVKADSLHQVAERVAADGRWREAASLYRRSADFRAAEDPMGSRSLSEAGALAYAAGDRSGARGDLAHAGERALMRGDLKEAAMAYLDAAWIAQEQRKQDQVWDLGHRAEILAESPLLSDYDRRAILSRIDRSSDGSQLAMHVAP